MPSPNPQGARFEAAIERAFRDAGIAVERPRQTKPLDVGDLHVSHDIVVQAKAWKNMTAALRAGTIDARAQARRAHRPIGVAVIKNPGAPILEAYVAMPLHVFISLLHSRQSP